MKAMNLQEAKLLRGNDGTAIRATSSLLLVTATALLVGSLITAHSAKTSPNSGRVTVEKAI